jgi:hypothetical protein
MSDPKMPWAARRIRFLSISRGPSDWGDLLYEPDWSRRFPLKNIQAIFFPAIMIAFAALFVSQVVRGNIIPGREIYAIMMGVMILGGVLISLYLVVIEVKTMPFRVYERGFTVDKVPFMMGLHRREVLVPRERIVSVTVRFNELGKRFYSIVIRYKDEGGSSRALEVHQDDPLSALEALVHIASDILDDRAKTYLDPEGISEEVVQETKVARSYHLPIMIVILFLLTGTGFIIGLLFYRFSYPSNPDFSYLHLIGIFGFVIVGYFVMVGFAAINAYISLFEGPNVKAGDDGLEVSVPFVLGLLLRAKTRLPYDRVRRARKYFHRMSFKPMYQMLVGWSRPISISASHFRELSRRSEFERIGFELVNKEPPPQDPGPLVRLNIPSIVGLIALFAIVSFLVLSAVDPFSDDGETSEGPEEPPPEPTFLDKLMFFTMIPFGIGLSLFMFLRLAQMARIKRRAEGIEIDETSIRLPNARAPFGEVSLSDIKSITVKRRFPLGGYVLVVVTTRGRLWLPNYVLNELKEHGYSVELPENVEDRVRWLPFRKGS